MLCALGFTAPRYALQLTVIAQGPTQQAATQASVQPSRRIERWIAAVHASAHAQRSQVPAILASGERTSNRIALVHYSVASADLHSLDRLAQLIRTRSPWRVTDISRGGEFAAVRVRPGVTILRLAETIGTPDARPHVRLQMSGPGVRFTAADVEPLLLLVLLVFGFAGGMTAAAVYCQVFTLALFACFLITDAAGGAARADWGIAVLDAVVTIAALRWLWITGTAWNASRFLVRARFAFAGCTLLLCVAGALIAV